MPGLRTGYPGLASTADKIVKYFPNCQIYVEPFAGCLLYTSPSPRDVEESRMPSSA